MSWQRLWVYLLLSLIVGGHIAMWTSDMPRETALRLTLINATAWAVILLPAYGVAKWAAIKRQDKLAPHPSVLSQTKRPPGVPDGPLS